MIATSLLVLACALAFHAILRRDEKKLLIAIVAYAAAILYIVKTLPELSVPAMVLAIALTSLGLFRFLAGGPHTDSNGSDPR